MLCQNKYKVYLYDAHWGIHAGGRVRSWGGGIVFGVLPPLEIKVKMEEVP